MKKERTDIREDKSITDIAKAQRESGRKTLRKILMAGALIATTAGGIAMTREACKLDIDFGFERAIGETSSSMAQYLNGMSKGYKPNNSKTPHESYTKQTHSENTFDPQTYSKE